MAYSALPSKSDTDTLDLTTYNKIKGNFEAGCPDIMTAKGDLVAATAANAAAPVAVGDDDSTLVADASQTAGLAWQIVPAVHLTLSGAELMDQEVWTSIEFDTETGDTDSMHEGVTNPERITIPTGGSGWFLIGFNANASRAAANDSSWQARVLLNGTTEIAHAMSRSDRPAYINLSIGYPLTAADYIEVQYYSGAVADQSIAAGASFWAIWQRRQ